MLMTMTMQLERRAPSSGGQQSQPFVSRIEKGHDKAAKLGTTF
jgi:hypothetical protein